MDASRNYRERVTPSCLTELVLSAEEKSSAWGTFPKLQLPGS